jgi:hypothetical protein
VLDLLGFAIVIDLRQRLQEGRELRVDRVEEPGGDLFACRPLLLDALIAADTIRDRRVRRPLQTLG